MQQEQEQQILPKSFRITDETAERFRTLTKELGGSQQLALAKLLETYDLIAGHEFMPEWKDEIATLEGYLHAITSLYVVSLEKTHNMRELVKTEYDELIRSKDRSIIELQERVKIAEETANTLKAENNSYVRQLTKEKERANEAAENVKAVESDFTAQLTRQEKSLEATQQANSELTHANQELRNQLDALRVQIKSLSETSQKAEELSRTLEKLQEERTRLNDELEKERLRRTQDVEDMKARCEEKAKLQLAAVEAENERLNEELSRERQQRIKEVESIRFQCEESAHINLEKTILQMELRMRDEYEPKLEELREKLLDAVQRKSNEPPNA